MREYKTPQRSRFRKSRSTLCENQSLPFNKLNIEIVSRIVCTQALAETEGNPNGLGCCGLPSVSARGVELALNA